MEKQIQGKDMIPEIDMETPDIKWDDECRVVTEKEWQKLQDEVAEWKEACMKLKLLRVKELDMIIAARKALEGE